MSDDEVARVVDCWCEAHAKARSLRAAFQEWVRERWMKSDAWLAVRKAFGGHVHERTVLHEFGLRKAWREFTAPEGPAALGPDAAERVFRRSADLLFDPVLGLDYALFLLRTFSAFRRVAARHPVPTFDLEEKLLQQLTGKPPSGLAPLIDDLTQRSPDGVPAWEDLLALVDPGSPLLASPVPTVLAARIRVARFRRLLERSGEGGHGSPPDG